LVVGRARTTGAKAEYTENISLRLNVLMADGESEDSITGFSGKPPSKQPQKNRSGVRPE
jgi:hypothetical protein